MSQRIPLVNKNDAFAVVDDHVFEALANDPQLSKIRFLEKLRRHSHGYAFFQKYLSGGTKPKYLTIYLHKYVADRFIPKPESDKKLFVRFIDGDVLNVRLDNLEWVTMSQLKRHMKGTKSSHGYRGVTMDRGRFRAIIYHENQAFDLGFFDTAEEAGRAYNKKSIELFGKTDSLNIINPVQK